MDKAGKTNRRTLPMDKLRLQIRKRFPVMKKVELGQSLWEEKQRQH